MKHKKIFSNKNVPMKLLKRRAYNSRWATVSDKIIPLTAADPDFKVAKPIINAINDYAEGGVFSYGPPEGLPEFRKACSKWLFDQKNFKCEKELILAVDSAASGMKHVVNLLLKPGDEAIIFDPVDFLFKATVESTGAEVKLLSIDPASGRIDFDSLKKIKTEKTKLICLCNPHNPIGNIFSKEDLIKIGDFALENKLHILNDEIWSDIVYDKKFVSLPAINDEYKKVTFTINGFSKNFGLAGLRIGYIVAPTEKDFNSLLDICGFQKTISGASTLSQIAAIAAYNECGPWLKDFLLHLKDRRDQAIIKLEDIEGVQVSCPDSTYVIFPKLDPKTYPDIYIDPLGFTEKIKRDFGVSVVPGAEKWFGPGALGHIRIVFSTSDVILEEGLSRLRNALNQIK